MTRKHLQSRPWYSGAVAICIGVVLYVVLTRFSSVWGRVSTFLGYFAPVLYGLIIAYLVNPLALFFRRRLFRRMKNETAASSASNALAFISILLFFALSAMLLIPQLVQSVKTFIDSMDNYTATLKQAVGGRRIFGVDLNIDKMIGKINAMVTDYFSNNVDRILSTSASTGKTLIDWVIGFILALYLLAEKQTQKAGAVRLMRALLSTAAYEKTVPILKRCDAILTRYIACNLLDGIIIGAANAAFMLIARLPYVGLVSFIVGITNLIPTFGPLIGAIIGAFVLLLVNPWAAAAFLAFSALLQTFDSYILKPKLFGNSLGVSGLWILIAIVIGGSMFGVVGILLAIPGVAILDFLYNDHFLPWLEARKAAEESAA